MRSLTDPILDEQAQTPPSRPAAARVPPTSSEPPARRRPTTQPPATPADSDAAWVAALRQVGLVRDLDPALFSILFGCLDSNSVDIRRIDLLLLYYFGGGRQPSASQRRVAADRTLLCAAHTSAHSLIRRFGQLSPELPAPHIQRVGTDRGALILRAGHHFSSVDDPDIGDGTVSARALARAANGLLASARVHRRMIRLRTDGARELYVLLDRGGALELAAAGHLDDDPGALQQLGHW
ncbi:MAG: hypothetical protein KC543_09140 [Myxococcales bacterium]|nr:hypothetical protein [Myxococcales bacterium]